MKDPEFLAEAQKEDLTIEPLLGEPLQKRIEAMLNKPTDVVERLKRAIED